LFCKLVGPFVIVLVVAASVPVAVYVTLGMNLVSVSVEYICIGKVCVSVVFIVCLSVCLSVWNVNDVLRFFIWL
jgi:hypothetical protein